MASKKKTWIWILVGIFGFGVLCIIAVAGFGIYFISSHVKADQTSSAEALQAFDDARQRFKDVGPVFELDREEDFRTVRKLEELPTSAQRAQMLHILVWDPDRERLVRVTMPFWLLRLGRKNVDLTTHGFDFQRLRLDMDQLDRVGPILLFDFRPPDGERVLVWTQ